MDSLGIKIYEGIHNTIADSKLTLYEKTQSMRYYSASWQLYDAVFLWQVPLQESSELFRAYGQFEYQVPVKRTTEGEEFAWKEKKTLSSKTATLGVFRDNQCIPFSNSWVLGQDNTVNILHYQPEE